MKEKYTKPEAEKLGWKVHATEVLYQSPAYDIRQDTLILPNQSQFTYAYFESPGAVFVVPVTATHDVLLMRSYRYPIDTWCWEIPGGVLNDQPGCTPEEVARQELAEEIGATCQTLELLGQFYLAQGIGTMQSYVFLAFDVTLTHCQHLDALEAIDTITPVPVAQLNAMIRNGKINNMPTAFALLLALEKIDGQIPKGE